MSGFRALVLERGDGRPSVALKTLTEADLMDGDVTVRVTHSTVNYKDGLAITGKAPIVRRFPMVPGIDFAGIVEASSHPDYRPGDQVVLNGWGVGETHFGGYAERARVNGDWLVPLPAGLSPEEAMAIGTAGYTAMLCVIALESHGLTPAMGAAVVTGASGGVGSVAIALLTKLGWHVIASTGRTSEADYLRGLGAAEIIDRNELSGPGRPLAKERWIAGVELGWLAHACEPALDDALRRCHRGLRPGAGSGSAGLDGALYSARGFAVGNRQRDVPAAAAARSVATPDA